MVGKKSPKKQSKNRFANLDRNVKVLIEKEDTAKAICITVRDSKLVVSGQQNLVSIFKDEEAMANMSVKELFEKCQRVAKDNQYELFRPVIFPPLTHKFKGPAWKWNIAQENLQVYFNVMGFGRGSSKEFGKESSKPDWWPNSDTDAKLQWTRYKHPTHTTFEHCNLLLNCIFDFYNIDKESHFVTAGSASGSASGSKKRLKKKTSRRIIDDDAESEGECERESEVQQPGNEESDLGDIDSEQSEDVDLFDEMMNDDYIAEIEAERLQSTLEVPSTSGTPTVVIDKSVVTGKRKRGALSPDIFSASASDTDIEFGNEVSPDTNKRLPENIPPYLQLRMNNIAERKAAMKDAEERGLF